jgi:hypothetical protein
VQRELLGETAPLMIATVIAAITIALALEAWLGQIPVVTASGVMLAQSRDTGFAALVYLGLSPGFWSPPRQRLPPSAARWRSKCTSSGNAWPRVHARGAHSLPRRPRLPFA